MTQVLTVSFLFISTLLLAQHNASVSVLSIDIHKGDISLEDPPESVKWETLEEFGIMDNTTPVHWLRLTYQEPSHEMGDSMRQGVLLLSLFFDKVESFKSLKDNKPVSITGKMVEFQDRSIAKGFYKNALPLHFDDSAIRYIKLTCYRPNSLVSRSLTDLEYLSRARFEKRYTRIRFLFVLITGMEILLCLIFLYMTYLNRSGEYIFYTLLILASTSVSIIHFQVFDELLGLSALTLSILEFSSMVVMIYSFSAFGAYYLKLWTHANFWHKMMVFPYILIVIPLYIYTDYFYLGRIVQIYFFIVTISIAIGLIKSYKKYAHRVRIFLLAHGNNFLMAIVTIMALKDILPHNFFTVSIMYLSFVLRDVIFVIDLVKDFFNNKTRMIIKEAEVARLQKEKEELKAIERSKTTFFNNISHELRTPLTLLLGPLKDILTHEKLPGNLKQELSMSMRNGTYLLQLVNEILDLSKLNHGTMRVLKEKREVVPILSGIIESFKKYADEKEQTISFEYPPDKVSVHIDQVMFEKIIINLLSNAIKYSQPQKDIRVKVKDYEQTVIIAVEDSGIGISRSDIDKIFDRYYQVDPDSSAGGTGLGLSIVKEFMEMHGGQVQVKSEIGKGSVFELTFFKVIYENGALEKDATSQAINSLKSIDPSKSTLLLVEDNHDMRQYLDHQMTEYNIFEAANGLEALDLLKSIPRPDLILTDYMMPVMDGAVFIQKLKQDEVFSMIPVIFLSARTLQRDKVDILNLGVDDYIIKPFDMQELKLRINISLKNSRSKNKSTSISVDEFPLSEMAQFKKNLDTYIIQNIQNQKLSVLDLAYHFAISETSVRRKIKTVTGQTPAAYIREIRLQLAKRKIEYNERSSISEIAHELGMSNLSHFTQAFKKRFGKLPSEYFEKFY